jgi:hypothetical protein
MARSRITTSSTSRSCGSVTSKKRAIGPASVHLGGLVELVGDRLQAGEHGDHDKGKVLPRADEDQAHHGVRHLAEPVERHVDEARREQHVVEDAVEVVEQPAPDQNRDDRRHEIREQDQPPGQRPEHEVLVQ